LGFTDYHQGAHSNGILAAEIFVDDPGKSVYASGIAVLLFAIGSVREDTAADDGSWKGSAQSFWLTIRDVGGGAYRREGLITGSSTMNEPAGVKKGYRWSGGSVSFGDGGTVLGLISLALCMPRIYHRT
jgi:hypothetical protein